MPYHMPLVIIAKWKLNQIIPPCCYLKVYNNVPASSYTVLKVLLPKIIAGPQIICPQCISQSKATLVRHVVISDYTQAKITALRRPGVARCSNKITALRRPGVARCSNKIFLKVSTIVPRLRLQTARLVTSQAWLRPCGYTVGYSSIHTVSEHSWTALDILRLNYLTSAEILCRNFLASLRG
jgi:hypothetical protein